MVLVLSHMAATAHGMAFFNAWHGAEKHQNRVFYLTTRVNLFFLPFVVFSVFVFRFLFFPNYQYSS